MELQFEKRKVSCLDFCLREVQNQEQTQEIRLPDGMPDIGRVLTSWGQVLLRSKEWREGSIAFSGGIMAWVLYAPEDGTDARVLETWIPFQMQWDLPSGTREGDIRISCLPRFTDARSVSARKILIRAGIAALGEALAPAELEVYEPSEMEEGVHLLRDTYPVRLPREAGEKAFALDEDLTLPGSCPQPEKLLYYCLRPQITDQKVMANKVVFRGNGNLHVLYRGEEGQLQCWDFDLPFSQFAELSGEYSPDAQADIRMCVTSLELELDEEGHLRLKAGLLAQFLVDDRQLLELTEDAYSPARDVEVHTDTLRLPVLLERRTENMYGEQTIPMGANVIADAAFLPDYPRFRTTDGGLLLEIPGTFQVLFYGEDGALQSGTARWEGQWNLPADENARVTVQPELMGQPRATAGDGRIDLRGDMQLKVEATGGQGIPMVTGLSLGEQREPDPMRPSLILRRVGRERLWDIAKETGSTVDAIRLANALEEDPEPNRMLLIPVS